ncbi:uncharacterized protein VTP21DRAFT_8894 [Calcarisporiella thermophila]|uniref:uncharacterized protein n=1 Tax=Calcarisporiella thermophila TaxID=911321 RepID=UPI0037439D11
MHLSLTLYFIFSLLASSIRVGATGLRRGNFGAFWTELVDSITRLYNPKLNSQVKLSLLEPDNSILFPNFTPDPSPAGNYLRNALASIPTSGHYYLTQPQLYALQKYAKLAAISHCKDLRPGPFSCRAFCEDFHNVSTIQQVWDTESETRGYIARDDARRTLVVSFSGANTWMAKLYDVTAVKMPYPHAGISRMEIHTGLVTAYSIFREGILSTIVDQLHRYPDYAVELIGYSMGAAFSIMLAIDLFETYPNFDSKRVAVVTFGEMRFGNREYADYVDSYGVLIKRIVNKRDCFPNVLKMSQGYRHHSQELWVKPGPGIETMTCEGQEDPQCSNSISFSESDYKDHFVYYGIDMRAC